jgi:hypothetical protein
MKVAIIGGRDFQNYDLLKFKLLPYKTSISQIISGGASGADNLGEIYAKENNIPLKVFEAEWENFSEPCKIKENAQGKKYNALAGFNRNSQIIQNSDFVIAFWNGSSPGTRDSIGKAHKLKKDILIIYY